ncbi:MAG: hypothetical protein GY913_35590 [Proteobacteria bacterium]|nr:hypothetical protein [Pseudomonadota bacterium]MCP4922256.1 hypothetical protein [Pseudomonadota bacterium]
MLLLLACTSEPTDTGFDYGSHELVPFESTLVEGFLCPDAQDPESATDVQFIECAIEGENDQAPEPVQGLVVMTWNIERGYRLDEQLAAFGETIPVPDILLLSESDRGCERTGQANVTQELADALQMNWAYAVEFVELGPSVTCEHGNAVLSRYPLANVEQFRHSANHSWYEDGGEPRLGGRIAIAADVVVEDRFVHVVSVHFESTISAFDIQVAQAVETAEHAAAQPFAVIAGGDTNAPYYTFDLANGDDNDETIGAFLDRGLEDTHLAIHPDDRATRGPLVLDVLLARDVDHRDPAICSVDDCDGLSDHLPVWTTVSLR